MLWYDMVRKRQDVYCKYSRYFAFQLVIRLPHLEPKNVLFIFGRGEGAETIWYLHLSISEGIIVTVQYAMLFHQFMTLGGLPPN